MNIIPSLSEAHYQEAQSLLVSLVSDVIAPAIERGKAATAVGLEEIENYDKAPWLMGCNMAAAIEECLRQFTRSQEGWTEMRLHGVLVFTSPSGLRFCVKRTPWGRSNSRKIHSSRADGAFVAATAQQQQETIFSLSPEFDAYWPTSLVAIDYVVDIDNTCRFAALMHRPHKCTFTNICCVEVSNTLSMHSSTQKSTNTSDEPKLPGFRIRKIEDA